MFKDEYLLDFINVEEKKVDKPDDMDEKLREALPDMDEMRKLLTEDEI